MAKIRRLEDLDDAISSEITWRKVELTRTLTTAQKSTDAAGVADIRSGVVMLYAHWEGWVKAVARLYIRYVNTQRYTYSQLSSAFLGNALKTRLTNFEDSNTASMHNEFASFIQGGLQGRATISERLIRTDSNLSSTLFYEILDRLGITRRNEYTLKANLIDRELVDRRNTIAHGQHLEIKFEEFKELRNSILNVLEMFTDDVRNAASMEGHCSEVNE